MTVDLGQAAVIQRKVDALLRYLLYDTDSTGLIKKRVPIVGGVGLTNLYAARAALGNQFVYDAAGCARAMRGVAIVLNAADVQRYRPWLQNVEIFIDPGMPDVDLGFSMPSTTNGHAAVPQVQARVAPPSAPAPAEADDRPVIPPSSGTVSKRGIAVDDGLWTAVRDYAETHERLIRDVLEQMFREFLANHAEG